jgi:DNA-binding NarL/FixJ family response regulator
MIKLVLADDHRMILEGLEQLFRREADFQVMGTATNGEEALAAVKRHRPDILVLDINMPRGNGMWVLKQLKPLGLPTQVVLLTASLEEEEVVEAVRAGVRGLVLKEAAAISLVECARQVAAGERVLDNAMIGRALDHVLKREADARELTALLSPRETDIVKMVATGMRNKEIASRLAIGEGTVKSHLHAIYEKLGVHGRVELARYAYERGLAASPSTER